MMEQITQELAERCRKACEFDMEGKFEAAIANFAKDNAIAIFNDGCVAIVPKDIEKKLYGLPLDPHFWRPRLEDRLIDFVEEKYNHIAKVQMQFKEGLCAVRIWDAQQGQCPYCSVDYKPICEVLCEVIEKLTENQDEIANDAKGIFRNI